MKEKNNRKGKFMSFNSNDYKGFTFRSGPSKKQTKSYSSFWDTSSDSNVDEFLGLDTETPKGKDIVALAGYKRAIGNFVNIVTGENIPVSFNNNDESFTDGKRVVIGSNLNEKNFDVAVGLALHEGSHIKLSDFNLLKQLEIEIPAELYVMGENKNVSKVNVIDMVKSILNYVEDRRIDTDTFKSSPGYKGYYHSMYNKYFYSKNVDKGLLSSEFRMENIDSYMFRIINLHNKNRQLGSLKGLKEIYSLIGLWNISRLEDSRGALNVALDVSRVIFNSIDKIKVEEQSDTDSNNNTDGGTGGDEEGDSNSGGGSGGDDDNTMSDEEFDAFIDSIENGEEGDGSGGGKSVEVPAGTGGGNGSMNDDGSTPVELSDRQKELLQKAFEKQQDFVNGDVQKTKMSKKDNNSIKAIEESGASYEHVGNGLQTSRWSDNVGKGTKCLVVKNLTQSIIDSNIFGCATKWHQERYNDSDRWSQNYNFVEEGLRLGNMLGRKLQVRGEESSLKYSRKNSGKIDKRLLSELGFGNSNVFSQTFVERFNQAYLHISVDASGSMSGDKWNKAMTSAVAMIKACDMAGNIDVVVSIRTTHSGGGYSYRRNNQGNVPLIMVVFDSRKDKLTKVRNLFPALDVDGTTPEGLCFEAIEKELIPGNSNQDSYFVNYSDGQPYYGNSEINYSGESAERHTAKMVNNMRAKGINVLSYFIGGSYESDSDNRSFKNMYGNDASFINATNMMDVAKTMNKKFLEK